MRKESKITKEAVGLLLFGLYADVKRNPGIAIINYLKEKGFPGSNFLTVLKNTKVLVNTGGSGRGASWKWNAPGSPDDILIAKVLKTYQEDLKKYVDAINARKERRKSVESVKISAFTKDALDIQGDKLDTVIDLLTTLCKNLGVQTTLAGKVIE